VEQLAEHCAALAHRAQDGDGGARGELADRVAALCSALAGGREGNKRLATAVAVALAEVCGVPRLRRCVLYSGGGALLVRLARAHRDTLAVRGAAVTALSELLAGDAAGDRPELADAVCDLLREEDAAPLLRELEAKAGEHPRLLVASSVRAQLEAKAVSPRSQGEEVRAALARAAQQHGEAVRRLEALLAAERAENAQLKRNVFMPAQTVQALEARSVRAPLRRPSSARACHHQTPLTPLLSRQPPLNRSCSRARGTLRGPGREEGRTPHPPEQPRKTRNLSFPSSRST
jgi:hypothetical protein